MTANVIKCLTQVATYLKVSPGKINLDSNSMPVRTNNNVTTKGFISIVLELLNEAKCKITDKLEAAEIRQWLEYCSVYVARADGSQNVDQVLKELNSLLDTKTYLVAYNISIADVVMFYVLHHIMVNLSYLDKEKHLHLSRWFDNVQQDASVRQKNKVIDFGTNYLSVVAPARH